jgi:hypothetical protein
VAWPGDESVEIREVGEHLRMTEVSRYRVFDDPQRDELVLYKLSPR